MLLPINAPFPGVNSSGINWERGEMSSKAGLDAAEKTRILPRIKLHSFSQYPVHYTD
jgi:hypothetical protein